MKLSNILLLLFCITGREFSVTGAYQEFRTLHSPLLIDMSNSNPKITPDASLSSLQLYFGKPDHELDANTLAVCLKETTATIEQICIAHKCPIPIEVRVKPFKSGSFNVPIEIAPIIIGTIWSVPGALPFIKQCLETFIEYLKLRKMLKGEEPVKPRRKSKREKGKISVKAANGSSLKVNIQTLNIYQNNASVNAAIEHHFQQLEQDKSVQSFGIVDSKDKQLFESQRADFQPMSIPKIIAPISKDTITEIKTVQLWIKKPVLDKKVCNWQFIQGGNPIFAKMNCPKFLKRIAQGENFAMGDRLEVEMCITQEFDPDIQTHKITKREIVKVLSHVQRQRQIEFNF